MSYNFAHHTGTEQDVTRAIHEKSLEQLQNISLRPRGFRDARVQAWTFLLGAESSSIPRPKFVSPQSGRDSSLSESWTQPSSPSAPKGFEASSDLSREEDPLDISEDLISASLASLHPDAHQVQLDTNRSFILYSVENHSIDQRKSLQEGLHDIILGVLQKRSRLRYFQGYHDIITVLLLTLPTEIVPITAEKMSLYRLRDSMGTGLDPLVGQLRVLKRLIRLVDPSYAEILEKNSPLPYYALSNLLTLFSHDVPTLPLIQHVFDWLLCREPIASIWLAAAVILSRKQDILVLEREGEEAMGMMHAVLSALPSLSDGESDNESQDKRPEVRSFPDDSPPANEVMGAEFNSSDVLDFEDKPAETVIVATVSEAGENQDEKTQTSFDDPQPATDDSSANTGTRSPTDSSDSWTADMPQTFSSVVPIADIVSNSASEASKPASATDGDHSVGDEENFRFSVTPETEIRSRRESSSPSRSRSRSHSRSPPGYYEEKRPPPPLPLSTLLHQASELLVKYPPSTPELHVTETFGPQSALHPSRYSLGTLFNLDDEEAEACVNGDDVVLPPTQEELEEESGPPRKPRESGRRPKPGKEKWRPGKSATIRRQTVVAGVVILIGVAIALYGFGPGGRGSARNSYRFGGERRVIAWVGGLLGLGQRLAVGF